MKAPRRNDGLTTGMTTAEGLRALRADAVARGLCLVCRCRFPRPGVKCCDACLSKGYEYKRGPGRTKELERQARSSKRNRDARLAAGLCCRCGRNPQFDGRTQCVLCLDRQAANARARWANR